MTQWDGLVPPINQASTAVPWAPKAPKVVCNKGTLTSEALGDGHKVATPANCWRLVHYVGGKEEKPACQSEEHLGACTLAVTQAQWLANRFFPTAGLVQIGLLETHPDHSTLPRWVHTLIRFTQSSQT